MPIMGWREKDGFPAAVTVFPAVDVIEPRALPPVIQGIVMASGPEFIALWFNSATRSVSRASVLAWRVSGPQMWPCTILPTEPRFVRRPDGVVFDLTNSNRWDNEGDWIAEQT